MPTLRRAFMEAGLDLFDNGVHHPDQLGWEGYLDGTYPDAREPALAEWIPTDQNLEIAEIRLSWPPRTLHFPARALARLEWHARVQSVTTVSQDGRGGRGDSVSRAIGAWLSRGPR